MAKQRSVWYTDKNGKKRKRYWKKRTITGQTSKESRITFEQKIERNARKLTETTVPTFYPDRVRKP